jgi:hypothetical protein
MCLTLEFFQDREAARQRYEQRGEVELEIFLEKHGLTTESCMVAGLLQSKHRQSTVELMSYEVSDFGTKYLREVRRHQLILVRRQKGLEMLEVIGRSVGKDGR